MDIKEGDVKNHREHDQTKCPCRKMLKCVRPYWLRQVSKYIPELFDGIYSHLNHQIRICQIFFKWIATLKVNLEFILSYETSLTLTNKITNNPTNLTENAEPNITPVIASHSHQFCKWSHTSSNCSSAEVGLKPISCQIRIKPNTFLQA